MNTEIMIIGITDTPIMNIEINASKKIFYIILISSCNELILELKNSSKIKTLFPEQKYWEMNIIFWESLHSSCLFMFFYVILGY